MLNHVGLVLEDRVILNAGGGRKERNIHHPVLLILYGF